MHLIRYWFVLAAVLVIVTAAWTTTVVALPWHTVLLLKGAGLAAFVWGLRCVAADAYAGTKRFAGERLATDDGVDARYEAAARCWEQLRYVEDHLDKGAISPSQFHATWAAEYARSGDSTANGRHT